MWFWAVRTVMGLFVPFHDWASTPVVHHRLDGVQVQCRKRHVLVAVLEPRNSADLRVPIQARDLPLAFHCGCQRGRCDLLNVSIKSLVQSDLSRWELGASNAFRFTTCRLIVSLASKMSSDARSRCHLHALCKVLWIGGDEGNYRESAGKLLHSSPRNCAVACAEVDAPGTPTSPWLLPCRSPVSVDPNGRASFLPLLSMMAQSLSSLWFASAAAADPYRGRTCAVAPFCLGILLPAEQPLKIARRLVRPQFLTLRSHSSVT